MTTATAVEVKETPLSGEPAKTIRYRLIASMDAAIKRFCSHCAVDRAHDRCVVFDFDGDNWERVRAAQVETLRSAVREAAGNLDLQDLFDACCEMCRYGFNEFGYQCAAADEVQKMIGRYIYEDKDLNRLVIERAPWRSLENHLMREAIRQLRPAFQGYSKTFYILRDVARALRGIRRPQCATCRRRFSADDGWRDRNRHEMDYRSDRWFEVIFLGPRNEVRQWSCSFKCYEKAKKQIEKEIKWLKMAREKQKAVRQYLRNNRAA